MTGSKDYHFFIYLHILKPRMVEEKDPYYFRPEVSNSDLTQLAKYWMPDNLVYDIEAAYRFGGFFDAMITESHKVNFFKRTFAGQVFNESEFKMAEKMKDSYWKDSFCSLLTKHSDMQKVSVRKDFPIQYGDIRFTLDVRLKWDLYAMKSPLKMTGDIKSTTAKTEKEFIAACHYFQYFRQRAWYMDIDEVDRDMLIGVSKVNYKVFKLPVVRGGEFHKIGQEQYQDLAFKWWYLFGDLSKFSIN